MQDQFGNELFPGDIVVFVTRTSGESASTGLRKGHIKKAGTGKNKDRAQIITNCMGSCIAPSRWDGRACVERQFDYDENVQCDYCPEVTAVPREYIAKI